MLRSTNSQRSLKLRGIAAIVFSLWLGGCSIKAPQAPSWDTTVRVPLISRTFLSGELFDKLASENIKTDSSGNSSFYIEKTLDTVSLDSVLRLDGSRSSYSKSVGRIKVIAPSPQTERIIFADCFPLITGYLPDTGVSVTKPIAPATSLSEATIVEGEMIVRVVNNTGFSLDSIDAELRNAGVGSLVAALHAPGGLADGASYIDTISLAGKTMQGAVDLITYFHTPGGLALASADRSIDFEIAYTNDLYAGSVTGKLDQFSNNFYERTKITDSIHLETATLATGNVTFSAVNNLPVTAELSISFPGITKDGSVLSLSLSAAADVTVNQSVDLSGYRIQPDHDSLITQITATIPSSGDDFVTVNSSDGFAFDFELSNLEISSATAVIAPKRIDWSSQKVDIEIPKGLENASLDSVELDLTILNHSELSAAVEIVLKASNGKQFTITGSVVAGSVAIPSVNHIPPPDGLADLITPIPQWIAITGNATVGDGVTTVYVTGDDYLSGSAVLSAPMNLMLGQTSVEGDKSRVDIDQDLADRVDRLQQGVFKATIINHLPLGARVAIYISTDSATLFTQPSLIIGPIGFDNAAVNGDGVVVADTLTRSVINLTSSDLSVFQNRSLYVAPIVTIAGTLGQTVRIRAADYLSIQGIVEITARVGGKDF